MYHTAKNEIKGFWYETPVPDQSFPEVPAKKSFESETGRRLKHSELRLKQAQAIAHIGSWEHNLATGIVEWSEEACRIHGLAPEDNTQTFQYWLSMIHSDDRAYIMRAVKEGQKSLTSFSFHYRIIRTDGAVRYVFSKVEFEFNEYGAPTYLHGITHDVTESKQAEQALIQAEANLRLIIDLMPQCIFTKDENGKFIFVNKSFAALFNMTPAEIEGKNTSYTVPIAAEERAILNEDREIILSGKPKIKPELAITDINGNRRIFYTVKVPYTAAGNNKKMVLGIAEDITLRKEADTDRTKMIADIVERNTHLEKFTYIVSHNLRAPVANIMGIADVLQIPGLSCEDKTMFTENLTACTARLNNVVMDLNDILQIERKENKEKEWVKLSDILADIEIRFAGLIRNEGVMLTSDFAATDDMFTIKGYLYSIFFNLVSNSIKYRQADVTSVIEITTLKQEDRLQIIIKDNGLGIDLEKRSKEIFGLYKRFHFHVDGKGMGLFMVKAQTESLGGKIFVSSEVNKGTEFKLEFNIN